MANLISPGVSVTVTDESFFIPAAASTVPLLFIATEDEKLQSDGLTPAAGTYEYDVIRTITSRKQLLELYGTPNFLSDSSGNQFHGDARNEYGLFTAYNFLGIGDRIFIIRANVNLNDDIIDVRALWNSKVQDATLLLENLAQEFINEFNNINGYIPGDASSGYQEANLTNPILETDLVGAPAATYDFQINIDGVGVQTINVVLAGGETMLDLLNIINTNLVGASVTIDTGDLRFTSDSAGTSSTIAISAGLVLDLFAALVNPFFQFDTAVQGAILFKETVTTSELISLANEATSAELTSSGLTSTAIFDSFSFKTLEDEFYDDATASPLDVYAAGYDQPASGTYIGFNGYVADWAANSMGALVLDEFLPSEAGNLFIATADDFQYTKEFKNGISLGANDAARRVAITTALQASVNSNQEIRSENFEFNLVAAPGYHEVADELVALSTDIGEEAFVLSDTPFDMTSAQTVAWSNTTGRQTNRNIAYYYPHSLASNIDGQNVFVPATSTALRTIAYSDETAELWFAPAGTRRGLVTGVSDVGYVSGQLGSPTTFEALHLNQGQRDDLYKYFTNINPITFFPGRGIIVWGQKTSSPDASAMDRINVVRLIMYIRRQLRKNTMSFVFEPNDQLTRDNLKAMVDGFLGDLIVRRGLYDAVTISDESNNTPDRIDRNELYIDVALKPVKAAEFIYIPIRVVNTGADI